MTSSLKQPRNPNRGDARRGAAYRSYSHATGSTLTLLDHGAHITGQLRWRGPLDDANWGTALGWLQSITRELAKVVILETATGRLLLTPQDDQMRCERFLTRRRFS
jgi:hypothetical protein